MLAVPESPDPITAADLEATRANVRAVLSQVRKQVAQPDSKLHKVRKTLQRKALRESRVELGPEDTHPPGYTQVPSFDTAEG